MSRIGKQPIALPKGVDANVKDGIITVKGPKGVLTQKLIDGIEMHVENDEATVTLAKGHEEKKNFHGLYRSLVNNMVIGVTEGFTKTLEMVGVGFRAAVNGNTIDLQIGCSHPTSRKIPEGITAKVEKNTTIVLSGNDKQAVGQFAADIRAMRKPEPYKGKGIKYRGEYIRRKAGKTAKQ
ncbi:MAG: 50S ribosomal protein L6 [Waddliaceae bacterium]|jgi:large subunit ribosomal protein L6|nr:50S ribosomal protein L6 [Waddliaceae bacterium]MBT3578646.1 50S ribosomal protein L6 [Waddliaceae bacterium]MBT4445365.1 50S ribosomal protein L6 [Waddliaceae bacterium]MBT6928367.1 50S ribosomal protein L6 [Waddliaceae bacterium]MBT7265053.1 50S ribosomal protein L6 [Waddliaceae bacterium]